MNLSATLRPAFQALAIVFMASPPSATAQEPASCTCSAQHNQLQTSGSSAITEAELKQTVTPPEIRHPR